MFFMMIQQLIMAQELLIQSIYIIFYREAHKIGILDIRIVNCDRNEQNILVKKYYLYFLTKIYFYLEFNYKINLKMDYLTY